MEKITLTPKQEQIYSEVKKSGQEMEMSKLINKFKKTMSVFQVGAVVTTLMEKGLVFVYRNDSVKYIHLV